VAGLASILQTPSRSDEQEALLEHFLFAAGYGRSDLLSLNYSTRIFLTRNGGKYRVESDGKLTRLAGPHWDPEERM
jgi:hypothetical protein